ncbi:helix-turn-helix transcriptional regulator [Pseudonocardia kujensis]|uniref:winged helix-turn-helix transcriptional regulator n=1 Tax=Pseudonocardia kujensis TaxID=1128675 RepID=UPI001E460763|nr:helix-turn-helix domain-containing protein [Pseudonocardia kujensis]MCE0764975.1 helix-turn-helix transcriptional regulator [Pseudonocardia kujensis]
MLTLHALADGPLRYTRLRASLDGISDRMLSATLRTLLDDGLLTRTVTDDTPPQVSYALSPLGAGAAAALAPLLNWLRANADAIETRTDDR